MCKEMTIIFIKQIMLFWGRTLTNESKCFFTEICITIISLRLLVVLLFKQASYIYLLQTHYLLVLLKREHFKLYLVHHVSIFYHIYTLTNIHQASCCDKNDTCSFKERKICNNNNNNDENIAIKIFQFSSWFMR